MKSSVSLFFFLSVLAMGMIHPVDALGIEERVYIFKTFDDPAVEYDPAVLERAPWWNPAWDAGNPPRFIVPLGASVWVYVSNNAAGMVMRDKVRQTCTATAVALLNDPTWTPYKTLVPFYFEAPLLKGKGQEPDRIIKASGYGLLTSSDSPEPGIMMMSFNLQILPDPAHGILGGSASSNSIFNFMGLPGYQTGSYWTVRVELE